MKNKSNLTIADYELLGQAYVNLIDAGMLLATVEYDNFLEAVCTTQIDVTGENEQDWTFELVHAGGGVKKLAVF